MTKNNEKDKENPNTRTRMTKTQTVKSNGLRSSTLNENQCNSLGLGGFNGDINNYLSTNDNSQNSSVDLQILQEWYQTLHTNHYKTID